MSTSNPPSTSVAAAAAQSSEFEVRRAELITEIGETLEQVLTQLNALNRGLEGIIEIGNEFASVEALWSQFESVMGREENGVVKEEANGDPGVGGNEHGADGDDVHASGDDGNGL